MFSVVVAVAAAVAVSAVLAAVLRCYQHQLSSRIITLLYIFGGSPKTTEMLHQEGDMQVCPYNPSHLIRNKRMITHLAKCRKNYLSLGYKICPMDATHHVPPEQYEEHMEKCKGRGVVDSFIYKVSSNPPANPILPKEMVDALLPQSDENWDDEVVPTYDPHAVAASRPVMRFLSNAPPAERRAFQQAERLRLLELQDRQIAQGPIRNVGRPESENDRNVRMPNQRSEAFNRSQKQNKNH